MIEFGEYMTPQQYVDEFGEAPDLTLSDLEQLAVQPDVPCACCEEELVWRLGQEGLCFRCATGERDASEDIEIVDYDDERLTENEED
jgi:hypothetical protein